jgi:sulfofructose kinase
MPRVLCVGIATQDQVFRLAAMPSRPEKHRASALTVTTGGTAANGAVALARLGADTLLWSGLGDDPLGDAILAGLAAEGIDVAGVARHPGVTSPLSAILVDDRGERTVISYSDPALPGPAETLPDRLPRGTAAVLGDTRWQAGSAHAFRLARAAGVPALLDADRAPTLVPEVLGLATHVAFAMQALRDLTGIGEPREALAALPGDLAAGDTWICVTNGPEGAFWREGGRIAHCPAFPVAAVDTLGAGDTFHGALALGLAEGRPVADAVRFASAAAAIKCTRFGGRDGAPSRAEVEAFLEAFLAERGVAGATSSPAGR